MKSKYLYLILILLLAAGLRLNNLNWDANFHLHPDERFLTMVGNAMKMPGSFIEYLNPQISKLNPANIGFNFYVYGSFPIILNKILVLIFGHDSYNAFTIHGRFLSALADLLVVILVYKTSELLVSQKAKNTNLRGSYAALWAAFFYAVAVLPIQLSHFFTVDSFLNLFMFASFYFILRKNVPLSAVFFGLAVASKITAVFILPLMLFYLLKDKKIKPLLTFVIIAYLALRLANPYYFQQASFFDPTPNKVFVENLKTLKSLEGRDIWYPPAVQWISKTPVVYSLVNLSLFGLGLPYFILVIIGMITSLKFKIQNSKFQILNYVLIWVGLFFLYQAAQFAQTMRYFIPIYPFLAIFAAIGIYTLTGPVRNFPQKWHRFAAGSFWRPPTPATRQIITVLIIGILLIWPVAFSSIYLRQHSRVAASEWIYKNIGNNAMILGEYWDDALPLSVENNYGKHFNIELLHVFDPDTDEKWQGMNELLDRADYYVLSSNRAWGSIGSVPKKYPLMSKFYNDLLAGRLGYKKIKEFTSYPLFDDSSADESFTVYDHPKVMIFKKI